MAEGVKAVAHSREPLGDAERVILDLRPHWVGLVWPTVAALVVVVVMGVLLARIPEEWPTWVRWITFGLGILILAAYPLRLVAAWVTAEFLVTSERVIHRSGWLTLRSIEIPVDRIADVAYSQSFVQRMVGTGDVVVESSGASGFARMSDIEDADDVQRTIYRLSDVRSPSGNSQEPALAPVKSPDPEPSPEPSPIDQIERLGLLKEKGLLSNEEFEVVKRKLLRRL